MKEVKCCICNKKGKAGYTFSEVLDEGIPKFIGVSGTDKYFCEVCEEKGLAEDLKEESRRNSKQ